MRIVFFFFSYSTHREDGGEWVGRQWVLVTPQPRDLFRHITLDVRGQSQTTKKGESTYHKKHVSEAALDEDRVKKNKSKKIVLLSHSTCIGVHRVHFRHYHPKKKT